MRLKLAMVGLFCSTLLSATDYGLVIGCCGDYKNAYKNTLRGTGADAKAFENILLDRGCSRKNLITLTNREATKKNIKDKLLYLEKKLDRGDRLYFYFSGHGARATDTKEVFFQEIKGDSDLNKRLNRTALIPYDFNYNNPYGSAIISYDDLRPVFKRLDRRGVNIVMFVDACFAGQAYKRGNPNIDDVSKVINKPLSLEEQMKMIKAAQFKPHKQTKDSQPYKSLIFFGASLTNLKARETNTINGKRGEFTTYLEFCLNNSDTDRDGNGDISKSELEACMINNFPNYAQEASIYPSMRLSNKSIIRATNIIPSNLVKVKYSGKINLQGVAHIVKKGYDLELVNSGNEIDIYRVGKLYATINRQQLVRYLKAYRLFSLKSNDSNVKIDYRSEQTDRREDTFCAEEIIRIRAKNLGDRQMTVLTLDKNGRVIILKSQSDYSVRTEVLKPYGIDRVKVFTYKNKNIFNKTLYYQKRNRGVLSSKDVNYLYELFSKEKTLKTQGFEIRTTPNNIKECLKGDR